MERRRTPFALLLGLMALWLPFSAQGGPLDRLPEAGGLTEAQRTMVESLMGKVMSYGECLDTLAACLNQDPPDPTALGAARWLLSLAGEGPTEVELLAAMSNRARSAAPAKRVELDTTGLPRRGPDKGLTIIEVADFTCPFCKAFSATLHQAMESFPGAYQLVFSPFPIKGHPGAVEAAKASLFALDQGRFWPMHDALFAAARPALDQDDIDEAARKAGLDGTAMRSAMEDPALTERLTTMKKRAVAVGVHGTPTLIINGKVYYMRKNLQDLKDRLEEELEMSARDSSGPERKP